MRAKIKSFQSVDVDDLKNFIPEDLDNFSFLLELTIGPSNEKGEESFNFQVCSPLWLQSNMKKEDIILGHHLIIVREYNYERILNKIESSVNACTGKDWNEISNKLARIAYWEFENYVE